VCFTALSCLFVMPFELVYVINNTFCRMTNFSKWYYECDRCRRIGWPTPNKYGFGNGRIWLDDVSCGGNETFIGDCHHRGWGHHNCRHSEDVAVACQNASDNGTFCQCIYFSCKLTEFSVFF